jgi:perosamine synthetase
MDVSDAERRITSRTRVLLPVHFWGCPTDMDAVCGLAQKYDLLVIEDCGQSHGALIGTRPVGTFSDFACYSFAPRKHISTGQGGLTLTRTREHADRVRALANKGKGRGWLDYQTLGFSYVMSEFEALLGLDGLRHLDREIAARRRAVEVYRAVLSGTNLGLPQDPPWGTHVYFKLPLLLPAADPERRDEVIRAIDAEGVSCRPTHPPLTRIKWLAAYMLNRGADLRDETLPNALANLSRIIEVETGPDLPEEEAYRSARAVQKVWQAVG